MGGEVMGISTTYVTCMMPFSYHERSKYKLYDALKEQGYTFFTLDNLQLQKAFYGDICVLHEEMDQYFLPYIERRIFPKKEKSQAFLRYSKKVEQFATLHIHQKAYQFNVLSVDIIACPFQVGFISFRIELKGDYTFDEVVDFMHHIRILEPKMPDETGIQIRRNDQVFKSVSEYMLNDLCAFMHDFINHDAVRGGYFGSLPFFEDERMLLAGYIEPEEALSTAQLYRLSQLDGLDEHGNPYISAENDEYMENYLDKRMNKRFSPKIEKLITEHVYMSIVLPHIPKKMQAIAQSRFMGTEYYQLILHYFYKLTLLKLSYLYSEVSVLHDQDYTEQLMEQIDQFSASYYFQEVSSRSTGIELANKLQEVFKIEQQYTEAKETLESLYRNQESTSTRRQNSLLFMLTIFTVLSGIYGMNLIIDEWKEPYKLSYLKSYTFFEWISFITAIFGIGLSIAVIATSGFSKIRLQLRKRKRRRYE